jgi:hypothetical protein
MTPHFSRMPETGYGSPTLQRACDVSRACREIDGSGPRASLRRLRAGSLTLTRYRRSLPTVDVRLTPSPVGQMIGQHFSIRRDGRLCYRDAQGVLRLPADFSEYLRGRHRQAVRTNVGHARRAGLRAEVEFVPDWAPGTDDSRLAYITPGPVERWNLLTADGVIAAQAILSVDEEVALLQGLMSLVPHGRWLLHTAMVERLCGSCEVLLINCDDAYLMPPGVQYFQRLLGYEIARLRLDRAPSPRRETVLAVGTGEVTTKVEV